MQAQSTLDQLRSMTTVVADTGDVNAMRAYAPREATTNPTLILKAAQQPAYRPWIDEVIASTRGLSLADRVDRLLVKFGREILAVVPGRVSTEVDARLSFDTQATVDRALRLIERYQAVGVDANRVLIKIAATWEGIRAAERLERQGVHCNLTLIFSLVQAVACAEAGVTLISPFVGRILDWHRKASGRDFSPEEDPGVRSLRTIYSYLKSHGFATEIMGASFRSTGQILALAGCDLLTIAPELLAELAASTAPVVRRLGAGCDSLRPPTIDVREAPFRHALNADAMATEKLAEGIRAFAMDAERLDALFGGA
ncbi:MAG: transaldolase [Casimicrobiaceae bacterium]